jgi:hypothetical protein
MEELAKASPEGQLRALDMDASHAAALGQVGRMRELRTQAIDGAKRHNMSDFAATQLIREANFDAELGYSSRASQDIDAALSLSREPTFVTQVADALATAGHDKQAEGLLAEARKARPEDTLLQNVIAPRIQARSQLRQGKASLAVQMLAPAQAFEDGLWFHNHVLRGDAYLASSDAGNAAQEFRRILARHAMRPFSFYYPLAQLGLARALAAQHDTANARAAYQDLFALWKDADPDVPMLKEAKEEYSKLQ